MAESLFISWKSIWRDQEITVDSTRQDGPWTVHLKLDKTWHLDKILFKVSSRSMELDMTFMLYFWSKYQRKQEKFQVFGYSVGDTRLLFVLVDRLMLWLSGFLERLTRRW